MKTKYYLTALALPALLAACTSDEFEATNSNAALKGRIEVKNVAFITDQTQTRLGQGDGNGDGKVDFNEILFQNNDGMGACLIDVPNGETNDDPIKNYNLNTAAIQTNYRYTFAEGAWTSQANMVEGNYAFYLPYSTSQSRAGLFTKLPVVQTLAKDANGEYSTFADVIAQSVEAGAPLVAGYKFLSAADENTQLQLTLQPIYAYPQFSLVNMSGADLTINQIVIAKATGTFKVQAPFEFAKAARTAYLEAGQRNDSFVDCFFDKANGTNGKNGKWSAGVAKNTEAKSTDMILGALASGGTSSQIAIKVPGDALTIKKGETFKFYAVIPADAYTTVGTNDLQVTVYTTDSKSATLTMGACTLNPGKRYPVEEYDNNGTTSNKGNLLTAPIGTLNTGNGVAVATTEALVAAINAFKPETTNQSLDIRIVSEEVTALIPQHFDLTLFISS